MKKILTIIILVFSASIVSAQENTIETSTAAQETALAEQKPEKPANLKPKSWWEVGYNFPVFSGEGNSFDMSRTYPDAWIIFPKTPGDPNGWLVGLNRNLDTGIYEKRNAIYPGVEPKGSELLLSKFYTKKYGTIGIKSRTGQSQGTFTGNYAYNGFGDTAYLEQKLKTFIFGLTGNYYPVKYIGVGAGYGLFYYYYKTWFTGDFTPLGISEPYKTSGWVAFPLVSAEIRLPVGNFVFGVERWDSLKSVGGVKPNSEINFSLSYRFGIKR